MGHLDGTVDIADLRLVFRSRNVGDCRREQVTVPARLFASFLQDFPADIPFRITQAGQNHASRDSRPRQRHVVTEPLRIFQSDTRVPNDARVRHKRTVQYGYSVTVCGDGELGYPADGASHRESGL